MITRFKDATQEWLLTRFKFVTDEIRPARAMREARRDAFDRGTIQEEELLSAEDYVRELEDDFCDIQTELTERCRANGGSA